MYAARHLDTGNEAATAPTLEKLAEAIEREGKPVNGFYIMRLYKGSWLVASAHEHRQVQAWIRLWGPARYNN